MRNRKLFVVLIVLMTFLVMAGTAYGAPKENSNKEWNISFLGTLQVPAQLEIVDFKDVLVEMIKINKKLEESRPTQTPKTKEIPITPQEITAAFEKYNIAVYQLALKNNGTYNTAWVFAAKMPDEFKTAGLNFFEELKETDKKQQAQLHRRILTGLKGMNEFIAKEPDVKDLFQMEILEFYPFEHMINGNAEMVSVGGSGAVRMYKLIQPMAFKLYFIKKNSELYMFGVINSGPDRKMWDNMSNEMLSSAHWNLLS